MSRYTIRIPVTVTIEFDVESDNADDVLLNAEPGDVIAALAYEARELGRGTQAQQVDKVVALLDGCEPEITERAPDDDYDLTMPGGAA